MANLIIKKTLTDSDSATWITYIWEATYNSLTELATAKWLAIWKITKVIETSVSATNKTSDEYFPVDAELRASNEGKFIWDNRASYTYK